MSNLQSDLHTKGLPLELGQVDFSTIGQRRWNVLKGDLPFPLAVLKESSLTHNLAWMQKFCTERRMDIAPHGKTTMSPALFRRQLEAGAWGISFATIFQLGIGVQSGLKNAIIANQVFQASDCETLAHLLDSDPQLQVFFLVDSIAQIDLIEAWYESSARKRQFAVLLELGIAGKRTGVRTKEQGIAVATRIATSSALALHGVECYEGALATCNSALDRAAVEALMTTFAGVVSDLDAKKLFSGEEILLTAGGSSIFDLVADTMGQGIAHLSKPVRRVLRSGCYLTHDHMHYQRHLQFVGERLRKAQTLKPALEVLSMVQSVPEPGLALLTMGRRDVGYDLDLPKPIWAATPERKAPVHWKITALNDQHAYLNFDANAPEIERPSVGTVVGSGISHPCTTFDKWRWMPIVDDTYQIINAVTLHF